MFQLLVTHCCTSNVKNTVSASKAYTQTMYWERQLLSHTCSCPLCHSCHPSQPGLTLVNWSDRPPEPAAAVVRGQLLLSCTVSPATAEPTCAAVLPAGSRRVGAGSHPSGPAPGLGHSREGLAGTETAARTAASGLQRLTIVRPVGRPA